MFCLQSAIFHPRELHAKGQNLNDLNETHKKANYSYFFFLSEEIDRSALLFSLSLFLHCSFHPTEPFCSFLPSTTFSLFSWKQEEIKSPFVVWWKISYIKKGHFKKVQLCQNLNGVKKEDKCVEAEIKFIKFALLRSRFEGEMDDVKKSAQNFDSEGTQLKKKQA